MRRTVQKHFDKAVRYLPYEETILAPRSLCKYQLGDEHGANRDLSRLKEIAQRNGYPVGELNYAENVDSLKQLITRMTDLDK